MIRQSDRVFGLGTVKLWGRDKETNIGGNYWKMRVVLVFPFVQLYFGANS